MRRAAWALGVTCALAASAAAADHAVGVSAPAAFAPLVSVIGADTAFRQQLVSGVGSLQSGAPTLPAAIEPGGGGLEEARRAQANALVRGLLAQPEAVSANKDALSRILGAAEVGRLESAGRALQSAAKAEGGAALAQELKRIRREVPLDGKGLARLEDSIGRLFDGSKVAAPAVVKAGSPDAVDPRGKSILIVGTLESRPFLIEKALEASEKLGLRPYVLDRPEARANSKGLVPDRQFIAAPIFNHDPKAMKAVVRQMADFHKDHPIDAVYTSLNPAAELAGDIRDRVGALGDSGRAVRVAHTKLLARQALNKVPQLYTPAARLVSPQQAARLFKKLSGDGEYQIVVKPIHGGASAMVKVGIGSPRELADAYQEIDTGLREFAKTPAAAFDILDHYPGIMAERQMQGPEVDYEAITQRFKKMFGMMSDNPPMDAPYAVEKGVTYPSQLSAELVEAGGEAAMLALRALNLPDGNAHIEMILTKEGWRIIEVNKRMGGLFVWEMIHGITGVDLIDGAIRSAFGVLEPADGKISAVREARMMIPKVSGTILSIEGADMLAQRPGVKIVRMLKKAGDRVLAAPEDSFDYFGYLGVDGKNFDEAMRLTMDALGSITFRIQKADGTIVEQKADHAHVPVDMNALVPENLRRKP